MKRARTAAAVWSVAGFGIAGVLGAHAIAYRLVVPGAAHRHEFLLRTGHGYWPHAVAIGIVAGIVCALAAVTRGWFRAPGEGAGDVARGTGVLVLMQAGGFLMLESFERVAASGPADRRVLAATVAGIALQGLVAVGGACLLAALDRAGARAGRLVRARSSGRPRIAVDAPRHCYPQSGPVLRSRSAGAVFRVRAPPLIPS